MHSEKTLAFTGLRPHKLPWGFNEDDPVCLSLKIVLRARLAGLIEDENVRRFITGMAMGIDQICAEIVLELKDRYPDITLEAAVPHKGQDMSWPQKYRDSYKKILADCDSIYVVSEVYAEDSFMRRNSYMVDKCDILLAVWNGRAGGTANTVKYAKHKNKRIIFINPFELDG